MDQEMFQAKKRNLLDDLDIPSGKMKFLLDGESNIQEPNGEGATDLGINSP